MVSKRSHPKFRRPNYGRTSRSRIKIAWRRPRGIDNKKRLKLAYMGCSPSIGYGQPSALKHKHPQGFKELLAQSPVDLAGAANVVIRIASGVGAVKREAIQKLAESMKLKVLNPRKFVLRVPKPKEAKKGEQKKDAARSAEKIPTVASQPKTQTEAAKKEAVPVNAVQPSSPASAPPKQ